MAKKKAAKVEPKLTAGEQDLLIQMENGYQLEKTRVYPRSGKLVASLR